MGKKSAISISLNKAACVLCVPLFTVMILDFVLTVVRQPSGYWNNRLIINEGNPIGAALLERDHMIFLIAGALWLCLIYFILAKLPITYRFVFFIWLLVGHIWASWTWVHDIMQFTFQNLPGDFPGIMLVISKYVFWFLFLAWGGIAWEKHLRPENFTKRKKLP